MLDAPCRYAIFHVAAAAACFRVAALYGAERVMRHAMLMPLPLIAAMPRAADDAAAAPRRAAMKCLHYYYATLRFCCHAKSDMLLRAC